MTPQEKAKDLFCKMYGCEINADLKDIYLSNGDGFFIAKDCALIAVDEIMRFPKTLLYTMNIHRFRILDEMDVSNWIDDEDSIVVDEMTALEYWDKVKQEIQKL
jgi:hypothetical protein